MIQTLIKKLIFNQGINQGFIQSKVLTQTAWYIIQHNFHIVDSTFFIPSYGIKFYTLKRSAHHTTR